MCVYIYIYTYTHIQILLLLLLRGAPEVRLDPLDPAPPLTNNTGIK